MLVVHVHCLVKLESIAAFRQATLANARASVHEPGIVRFDVLEEDGEPDRFVLVEVYRTAEDAVRHKETAHYATWRDSVAEMMAKPRSSTRFTPVFPTAESAWLCDLAEE